MTREFISSTYTKNSRFNYLHEEEKYIFKRPAPKYKFAIIGTGMIGLEHIKCTLLEGRAEIVGLYDISPRSIEMTLAACRDLMPGKQPKVYKDLESACGDPEVDALFITTPNFTHIQVLRTAIKYNKHIFVEKPMTTTLEDAAELVGLAKSHKKIFQIGLQYRYKAIYTEARHEALERRSLGDIKSLFIMEHRVPFLDKAAQWNKFTKYSGGTFVEKCCHYFDLFNLFAQSRPKTVYAVGSQAVNYKNFEFKGEKSDIIDNGTVIVTYENGIVATFHLCMFAPMFYEELVICGNEGRLKTYESEDYLPDRRPQTGMEILHGEGGKPSRVMVPSYPNTIQSSGHHGATYYEHIHFIDNMDGKKTQTATVEEGFWSVAVGCAAEESMRRGVLVDIAAMLREHGIEMA